MIRLLMLDKYTKLLLQNTTGIEDILKKASLYTLHQLVRSAVYLGEKAIVEFLPRGVDKIGSFIHNRYQTTATIKLDTLYGAYAMLVLLAVLQ